MNQQSSSDDFIDAMFGNDPNADAYYEEDQDINIEDGTYPAGNSWSNHIKRNHKKRYSRRPVQTYVRNSEG